MTTYDQKFGIKMIARTWRIFWKQIEKMLIFDQKILEVAITAARPVEMMVYRG